MVRKTDILIIGGGINGVGIALDAAGRGLNVVLCEQHDLASGTSSASTKLIHGGLRYLEYYQFGLVRESLQEREILLRKAPHIIHPLSFIMPYQPHLRPYWLIRLGLFLYDHLSKRKLLPRSRAISFAKQPFTAILQQQLIKGFSYADCWVDDARLVVLNALAAHQKGATILTRTEFIDAKREQHHWQAQLKQTETGEITTIQAKAIVNAAGPWVEDVLQHRLNIQTNQHLTLVKGSHIVVPKLYEEPIAFLLQLTDKRIIFVIPFQDHYSLIGTTDISYAGDLVNVIIDPEEINYLCQAVNRYFRKNIQASDVVWSYSGVRPLKQDDAKNPSAVSREYELQLNQTHNLAPLLSVFGGKITTYRRLAEEALHHFKPYFTDMGAAWTATALLPGGDIPKGDRQQFSEELLQHYPWLPKALVDRYVKSYGTLARQFLQGATSLTDLGHDFGCGLYDKEVEYLLRQEWACTADDILWRRTKLGLYFDDHHKKQLVIAVKNKLNNPIM